MFTDELCFASAFLTTAQMRIYFLFESLHFYPFVLFYTFTLPAQKWARHYYDFSILTSFIKSLTATPILLSDLSFLEQVNWDEEKECFESLSKELAMFYSIRKQYIIDEANPTDSQVQEYETGHEQRTNTTQETSTIHF